MKKVLDKVNKTIYRYKEANTTPDSMFSPPSK